VKVLVAGATGAIGSQLVPPLGGANHAEDFVAARGQLRDELGADRTGGTGNEHLHRRPPAAISSAPANAQAPRTSSAPSVWAPSK